MSNITLRTRITLTVAAVLLVITGLLTAFSISQSKVFFSGEKMGIELVRSMESIEMENINISITPSDAVPLDPTLPVGTFATKIVPMMATTVNVAQRGFGLSQILTLILVDIVAIFLTYFLLGKSLKPLSALSQQMHQIDQHHLSDVITLPNSHDEISKITESFNSMLLRLNKSFEAQKNFAAGAAHELKTPLAIMKSSLQVVHLDDNPTLADYEEATQYCLQAADNLTTIVNQLLEASLEDTEEKSLLNLKPLFEQAAAPYQGTLCEKSLSISYDLADLSLMANQTLVTCIFTNLLSNAIKYTGEGGTIGVTLKQQSDTIQFTVQDTGMGIDPLHLPHIFEPFYRGNDKNQPEGSGLGLQLVKTAVDKLSGQITVDSTPGQGSIFAVSLPL